MSDNNDDGAASGRDALDQLIAQLAREGAHRIDAECAPREGHLDAEALIAHLERRLTLEARRQVIAHLSACASCCDRLETAAELLRIDAIGSARRQSPARIAAPPLDIGPSLMRINVALERDCMRVLETDGELRVAVGATMRSRRAPGSGLAFRRMLAHGGELRLELLEAGVAGVGVCLALDGAPAGARVSRVAEGRIVETRPLQGGQAILRDVALRTSWLRLEAPGVILGHVRLELTDARTEGGA